MLELQAEPPNSDALLEADLRPTEEFVHKGLDADEAIRTLRGRTNRISIGTPQVTNILDRWPDKDTLAAEMASFEALYDFLSVRLACSFVPDRGCSFTWGRLAIELLAKINTPAEVIAFDLFPREVIDELKYKRSFSITPKLKFAFGEASASAKTEQEAISYDPRMIAAGLLTKSPSWTFTSDSRPGVIGIKELFLLIKVPKQTSVEARFVVGAEVRTTFGLIPLKRYGDDALLNRTYALNP